MFDPPPGYDDMLGDAEQAPSATRYTDLEVPDVGVVRARKPMPNAIPALAIAAAPKVGDRAPSDYLVLFVTNHLAEGEMDRVFYQMVTGVLPSDAVEKIARAISTWGTARPYVAVITLSVMAAHHWRTVRLKLALAGVADPMMLTSMHVLLDVVESMILEAMTSAKPDHDKIQREQFLDRLYAPAPDGTKLNGSGYHPAPGWFDPDKMESAFDAIAGAAR